MTDITQLLGKDADSLLQHRCMTIPADQLYLPGADYVDRVMVDNNRPPAVLRNMQTLYNTGRLAGTGYLSILPVDQGVEHSAGASFAANPLYFDPKNIVELAIEAGADDVQSPEPEGDDAGFWTILTQATDFQQVKVALEEAGIEITEATIAKIPDDTVAVSGEEAQKVFNLIEAIEDNDDVQSVYTNADIDAASLEG